MDKQASFFGRLEPPPFDRGLTMSPWAETKRLAHQRQVSSFRSEWHHPEIKKPN